MNTYSLIRVRPEGSAWLFGEVFYLPHVSAVPTSSIPVGTIV
ncbi:hypothetical protein [Hymenobacter sp. BT730]|nr:hypothetical protein [Hymenobacter sp. BT730]